MDASSTVYSVVKYGIIVGTVIAFGILIVGSLLVHDTYYIYKNPKFFLVETLLMGILTSLPILYLCYARGLGTLSSVYGTLIFFLKIVGLHIGFQLSGVYSVIFPKTSNLE